MNANSDNLSTTVKAMASDAEGEAPPQDAVANHETQSTRSGIGLPSATCSLDCSSSDSSVSLEQGNGLEASEEDRGEVLYFQHPPLHELQAVSGLTKEEASNGKMIPRVPRLD